MKTGGVGSFSTPLDVTKNGLAVLESSVHAERGSCSRRVATLLWMLSGETSRHSSACAQHMNLLSSRADTRLPSPSSLSSPSISIHGVYARHRFLCDPSAAPCKPPPTCVLPPRPSFRLRLRALSALARRIQPSSSHNPCPAATEPLFYDVVPALNLVVICPVLLASSYRRGRPSHRNVVSRASAEEE